LYLCFVKKCPQCNSNLYHHICYNCGWDDSIQSHERLKQSFSKPPKEQCVQCSSVLYHHICPYCNWDNDRDLTAIQRLNEKKYKPHIINETPGWGSNPKKKKKTKGDKWRNKRQKVYDRDGNECVKCGSTDNLTLDHIIPLSKRGTNGYKKLQTMCYSCNTKKSDTIELPLDHYTYKRYLGKIYITGYRSGYAVTAQQIRQQHS